jgi:hypothetical protein
VGFVWLKREDSTPEHFLYNEHNLGSAAQGKQPRRKGGQSYKARMVEIEEGSQLAKFTLVDGPKGYEGEKTT